MKDQFISEEYWACWTKWHGFWNALSREERREILALPILGHSSMVVSGRFTLESIERHPVIRRILKEHGCKPDDAGFHCFARLAQVCSKVGQVAAEPGNGKTLGDALSRLVLSREATATLAVSVPYSSSWRWSDTPAELQIQRFASRRRLDAFLAIPDGETGMDWERMEQRQSAGYGSLSLFTGRFVSDHAKAILRVITGAGEPVPLEKVRSLPGVSEKGGIFEKALRGLTQWVLAVVTVDADGRFWIGLWPPLAQQRRLKEKPAALPVVEEAPAEQWGSPFLLDEMCLLVTAAAVEPLPLTKQRILTLQAAKAREISASLPPVPDWVCEGLYKRPQTIHTAAGAALSFGFLKFSAPGNSHLRATPAGTAWVKQSAGDRLKSILDEVLARRWGTPRFTNTSWDSFSMNGTFRRSDDLEAVVSIEAGLKAAWKKVPADAWVSLSAFLDHASVRWSPLEVAAGAGGTIGVARPRSYRAGHDFVVCYAETLVAEARRELERYLETRLAPFGAVRLGRDAAGTILIQLTATGRYFFGLTKELDVEDAPPEGRAVVQPNFEVTFLGPNFAAETVFSSLAERLSRTPAGGTGTLFRLTRASIQRAAHAGRDLASILSTMEEATSQPLPPNVRTEIESWVKGRKYYRLVPATLIRCPSREVALRIHGALPAVTAILTDTVLELTGELTAAQRKKLEKEGLFQEPKRAGRRGDEAGDVKDELEWSLAG